MAQSSRHAAFCVGHNSSCWIIVAVFFLGPAIKSGSQVVRCVVRWGMVSPPPPRADRWNGRSQGAQQLAGSPWAARGLLATNMGYHQNTRTTSTLTVAALGFHCYSPASTPQSTKHHGRYSPVAEAEKAENTQSLQGNAESRSQKMDQNGQNRQGQRQSGQQLGRRCRQV